MKAFAAPAVVALALAGAPGNAQDLPRLHITALGLHADRASVAPGEIYHITIHVHVTQRRDRLDELVLPTLTNATDLGDERRRADAPDGGTDFYEIMTVSSPDPGTASFSPAYIDAIDPALGRGMRYSSNPLTVTVAVADGATSEPIDEVSQTVGHLLTDALLFVGLVVGGLLLLFVLLAPRRRRRAPRATPVAPAAGPPIDPVREAPPPGADSLVAAIEAFRLRSDDAALDRLRNVMFERAGAPPGSTLADALARLGGSDPALARAMAIAERVRFGGQSGRAQAVADLVAALAVLAGETVRSS